ncbi:hypothetical protein FGO68_gene5247 [Halteria grandinella]|uniref:Uncharacterized protein n=1 Tax=Halteria grandinella TaxID=5974 RepID=A0A8J8NHR0_HALGN|nr:hypothetical protein FGO68_gene5247 [Halteria grandinella]
MHWSPFSIAASECKHHDEGGAGLQVVVADFHLVVEVLAAEDELDLGGVDALPLLHCVLDVDDRVVGLEGEVELLAGQGLHDELHFLFNQLLIYQKQC